MLGFVTALSDVVSPQAVKKAVAESVPRGTQKLNEDAFDRGYAYGLSLKNGEKE
jgi:2-oxoglutarate ferredoxin oxidoreductase subunit gamma